MVCFLEDMRALARDDDDTEEGRIRLRPCTTYVLH